MTRSSLVVPLLPQTNLSTLERYSTPLTKPPAGQIVDIQQQGGRVYRVEFHAGVVKTIRRYGIDSDDFNPTIATMIEDLETDPKRYEKKSGNLANARAYRLRFRNAAWRAVFTVDDNTRVVRIIALDRHDEAYRDAARRID